MAIQVRRGNESDFNASKMLPGEWAVSLDTKYVRMCFAPGVVLRMATYEGFEADKAQIQTILAECRSIQSAVQRIQTEVNTKASLTVEYANDAKESADRAYSEAERAKTYADNAEAVTGVQIATKERAGLIKGGDNHIAEDGTLMLITTTDQTTQPNSYAGRENILEIGGGESEQDSTAGNQLLDFGNIITANSTVNVNNDTLTVSGTVAYSFARFTVNNPTAYIGQKLTLSFETWSKSNTSASVSFQVQINDTDGKNTYHDGTTNKTFDVPTNVNSIFINIYANNSSSALSTANTTTIKGLMLNAGTTALPYEPYTGGIPAPNPSYPMEIKKSVVSGVKTYGGENFYDGTLYGGYYYGVDFELSLANVAVYKSIKLNLTKGTHTILFSKKVNIVRLVVDGEITESLEQNVMSYTFTAYSDGYVGISFRDATSSTTVWDETTAIGVYKTSSITFSQPIELYGMGDVQDVITPKEIEKKYKKVKLKDFTFKQNTQTESGAYEYYASITSDRPVTTKGVCTHFKVMENSNVSWESLKAGEMLLISNTLVVAIDIATLDEFNEFISTNDVELVYRLITPTTEELPIADQIGLNSLQTYDGITYVEIDSEIQPTFKAEYGTSKVGGYTLEAMLAGRNGELYGKDYNSRLSALETSVVNNI